MFKSLSTRVVIALIVGLLAGAWLHQLNNPSLNAGAHLVEALGGLWLNALQMTVVPLVFSLLGTGIGSVADAVATGRLATRAVLLFTVLIIFASIYGIVATNAALMIWPVSPNDLAAISHGQSAASTANAAAPDFADWVRALAASNVFKAAAEPNVLQLVVFAIFFGFAATRLPPTLREPLVTMFKAVSEAVIIVVHWVLLAGPIGVFALSLGVGLNTGFDAAGGIFHYIVVVAGVTAIATPIAAALALIWAKVSLKQLTAAMAPVWAIAFSTQSSLASLPAMLEAARRSLQVPDRVADLVLPLAVAVFRFTSPIANLAVCVFIAHLYGQAPSVLQYASAVFVAFAVSVGSVGLPGQVSYVSSIAPICLTLGLPLDLIGIFLAVEVIPDIFRTLGNVTGDVATTLILNRGEKATPAPVPEAT